MENNNYKLIINSKESNVKIILPECLVVNKIGIISATFPYNFFNVSSNNNTLTINSTVVTLTPANYSITSLIKVINAILVHKKEDAVFHFYEQLMMIGIIGKTSFIFNPLNMGTILGFQNNTVMVSKDSEPPANNTYINGVFSVDITNNIRSINIKTNLISNNVFQYDDEFGCYQYSDLLATIPIGNTEFGSLIHFTPPYMTYADLSSERINFIEITILDNDQEKKINFNNTPYQIKIELLSDKDSSKDFIPRSMLPAFKVLDEPSNNTNTTVNPIEINNNRIETNPLNSQFGQNAVYTITDLTTNGKNGLQIEGEATEQ